MMQWKRSAAGTRNMIANTIKNRVTVSRAAWLSHTIEATSQPAKTPFQNSAPVGTSSPCIAISRAIAAESASNTPVRASTAATSAAPSTLASSTMPQSRRSAGTAAIRVSTSVTGVRVFSVNSW